MEKMLNYWRQGLIRRNYADNIDEKLGAPQKIRHLGRRIDLIFLGLFILVIKMYTFLHKF